MTNGFKIADPRSGVAVQLDPQSAEISVTYAPSLECLAFTATLRVSDKSLSEALTELCAGAGAPSAARAAEMNVRLSALLPRAASSMKVLSRSLQSGLELLVASKEDTNYTYDLTALNLSHLAAVISIVTARPQAEIEDYLREPADDAALAAHYTSTVAEQSPRLAGIADTAPRWGRRIGWYALVRALKPRCVVETGLDKGHGALLLCAALMRNAAEGRPGRYIGTDINPKAGYLLGGPYATYGSVLMGDSIASLKTLRDPVDIFINDSDHSATYEYSEYQTIAPLLHEKSVVIGDNAHVTDKLMLFAQESGRRFLFFRESPSGHWYPGAK